MRSLAILFFGLAACSRSPSPSIQTSPNVVNSAAVLDAGDSFDASADASVAAREDCAEPKKLTQLATVNEAAQFDGEMLIGTAHDFDPETNVMSKLTKKSIAKPTTTSRYQAVAGGRGLICNPDDGNSTASVEDVATKKKIFTTDGCAAGGYWNYELSATGRFLICDSNRSGATFWDLSKPHKTTNWDPNPNLAYQGISLAPNDTYAIVFPVPNRMTGDPTSEVIAYDDIDKGTTKTLSKASLAGPDDPNATRYPYSVAFCGDGALFVTSGEKEVAIYRGKDGARLAAAPAMKGGVVSFSKSGKYISQTRSDKTTVFRLDL